MQLFTKQLLIGQFTEIVVSPLHDSPPPPTAIFTLIFHTKSLLNFMAQIPTNFWSNIYLYKNFLQMIVSNFFTFQKKKRFSPLIFVLWFIYFSGKGYLYPPP
jgi:hypothetical protein